MNDEKQPKPKQDNLEHGEKETQADGPEWEDDNFWEDKE